MSLFDTYVMVDWSAKNSPTSPEPQENAVWWSVHPLREDSRPVIDSFRTDGRSGSRGPVFDSEDKAGVEIYERTRHSAIMNIQRLLHCEVEKNRRTLIGFDFAFGYPKGFTEAITGQKSARKLWSALSVIHGQDDRIVINDKENNENNRFAVAAELNRRIIASINDPSVFYGPFWGFSGESGTNKYRPPKDPYRLSRRPKNEQAEWPHREWPFGFSRKRRTDKKAAGSRSVFQLSGNGSVGSQALVGMRYLHGLRCHIRQWYGMKDRCVVWPFDRGFSMQLRRSGPEIVIVEIYPSLLKKYYEGKTKNDHETDRAQVSVNARAFSHLDDHNSTLFCSLFRGDRKLTEADRNDVTEEEGWILGAGFEKEIDDALKGWDRSAS